PVFAPDHSETALRFVTLIDICYELRRRVIVLAEDYPESLYAEGPVTTAFRRAASRLAEMQGWEEGGLLADRPGAWRINAQGDRAAGATGPRAESKELDANFAVWHCEVELLVQVVAGRV